MRKLRNIFNLGVKELRSLSRDPIMIFLIVFSFTFSVYTKATSMPESLNKVAIAVVDDDHSKLSKRIIDALYPPYFLPPVMITENQMDARMDAGVDTFSLHIPSGFERDVLAGRDVAIQLNVDATRMSQAFTGGGYIQSIVNSEITEYLQGYRAKTAMPVELTLRARFNPELNNGWFASVMEIINSITLLAIVLTGAALIREREHGTVEHLLVMPVTPFEIMISKVWSMGMVVLLSSFFSLTVVVQSLLGVPIEGSLVLFFSGVTLNVFAATSLGIFLGTIARSMPQFGLLMFMVLLPLQILSGAMTPFESMPKPVQLIMQLAPNTHFVSMAQAILYRGADFSIVWPQLLSLCVIGIVLFSLSLAWFRNSLGKMI
ncbi:ABC transporter permease [Hydrogenovibrio marinus]|uniref:Membrane protein n=1 Tax=Hydrogenovibrio marinus TaxID=28885 RepID=A0A066ZS42_HYDMR|nr:ABC transporter permease [Hydrogenovibrio marinus]KDN95094.1 membrane protein [Hydrogenovibrio marinus]BBN59566.1 membrane protein [Hydrogenovibrio marinus]